jgi:hypothetical protein
MFQPDFKSNNCKVDKCRLHLVINSGVIRKEDVTSAKLLLNSMSGILLLPQPFSLSVTPH